MLFYPKVSKLKKILLMIMALMFSGIAAASPLHTSIYYDEFPAKGLNTIYFSIYNAGESDYDELQAKIMLPELEERFVSEDFDLDKGEYYSGMFYYYIPASAGSGDYEMFFTVSNSEISEREYRYITIS